MIDTFEYLIVLFPLKRDAVFRILHVKRFLDLVCSQPNMHSGSKPPKSNNDGASNSLCAKQSGMWLSACLFEKRGTIYNVNPKHVPDTWTAHICEQERFIYISQHANTPWFVCLFVCQSMTEQLNVTSLCSPLITALHHRTQSKLKASWCAGRTGGRKGGGGGGVFVSRRVAAVILGKISACFLSTCQNRKEGTN